MKQIAGASTLAILALRDAISASISQRERATPRPARRIFRCRPGARQLHVEVSNPAHEAVVAAARTLKLKPF